ncbi:ATP-binding protein [Alicyclobacillus tolerans]|uniref:histidine kinase n=1 Tax=Alicyclobacillus tolerans TaxID=90970 RepID=A0A1M6ND11_9BACL|nr:ATP-binding protein [Alicyclobacillus montanus]SHJ93504.1 PAS domain S-box-containing protein [Alicyclobacillus montanus]
MSIESLLKKFYLLTLFVCGCVLTVMSFIKHPTHLDLNLIGIIACSAIAGAFPMILPGGIVWGTSVLFYMLALYEYGLYVTCSAIFISTFATFLRFNQWNLKKIRWFRFFSTLGMYFISVLSSFVFIEWKSGIESYIRIVLSIFIFEMVNLLLFILVTLCTQQYKGKNTIKPLTNSLPLTIIMALFLSLIIDNKNLPKLSVILLLILSLVLLSRQYQFFSKKEQSLEKKYELIANHTSDFIFIIDRSFHILYASPSFQQLFLLNKNDSLNFTSIIHPEDFSQLEEYCQSRPNHPLQKRIEMRLLHQFKVIYTDTAITPIWESDQKEPTSFMIVSRDISETIAQREYMLKTEKLAVIGELAAGVAHEIRNPLTAIKGFLQLFRQDLQQVSARTYDLIWSELERIEDITTEMLLLAKPQKNTHKVFHLSKQVHQSITFLTALANSKSILIEQHIEENLYINGDSHQMRKLIMNLVKNSIESIQEDPGNIQIRLFRHLHWAILRVVDNGIGMSEDTMKKIMNPFYTTKENGTGLGMTIVQRIVEEHNGMIEIQSSIGQGTTIEIRIPISTENF